jgi:hypothetical protein
MLYIDSKYISIVGAQLRNFKKKKENLYNCSCPICGDSSKKKTKARGYFYEYQNSAFYKCHNCHASMSLQFFLKTYSVPLHDSYALEKFSEVQKSATKVATTVTTNILKSKPKTFKLDEHKPKIQDFASPILDLPDAHYAKVYLTNRRIPARFYEDVYFTSDFKSLVLSLFPDTGSKLYDNDSRIVIPFYDQDKNLLGLQGRSLDAETNLRYITIKAESDKSLIYGLDRFNHGTSGYVVEGPIDSMFIPNCLATANSNLEFSYTRTNADLTLIYDNEPRNKEILKLMEKSILNNRKVCVWPNNIHCKDINDMIISGISENEVLNIIQSRTFSGLSAMLEFNQWKKIK